jgi:hypothetical protein
MSTLTDFLRMRILNFSLEKIIYIIYKEVIYNINRKVAHILAFFYCQFKSRRSYL